MALFWFRCRRMKVVSVVATAESLVRIVSSASYSRRFRCLFASCAFLLSSTLGGAGCTVRRRFSLLLQHSDEKSAGIL